MAARPGRREDAAGCDDAGGSAWRRYRGGLELVNAPLSSAAFITQHIAQERMPGAAADPRTASGHYDRRTHAAPRRYDLTGPV